QNMLDPQHKQPVPASPGIIESAPPVDNSERTAAAIEATRSQYQGLSRAPDTGSAKPGDSEQDIMGNIGELSSYFTFGENTAAAAAVCGEISQSQATVNQGNSPSCVNDPAVMPSTIF
ncbi:hypothetical protein EC988_010216, partial [Linderina pennispora]